MKGQPTFKTSVGLAIELEVIPATTPQKTLIARVSSVKKKKVLLTTVVSSNKLYIVLLAKRMSTLYSEYSLKSYKKHKTFLCHIFHQLFVVVYEHSH